MMTTIPRWKVTAYIDGREVTLFVDERHWSNVMRTVASLSFSQSGLDDVHKIEIEHVPELTVSSSG